MVTPFKYLYKMKHKSIIVHLCTMCNVPSDGYLLIWGDFAINIRINFVPCKALRHLASQTDFIMTTIPIV